MHDSKIFALIVPADLSGNIKVNQQSALYPRYYSISDPEQHALMSTENNSVRVKTISMQALNKIFAITTSHSIEISTLYEQQEIDESSDIQLNYWRYF